MENENNFLEGKKKGDSKNAVYALDEVLEFLLANYKKKHRREKEVKLK